MSSGKRCNVLRTFSQWRVDLMKSKLTCIVYAYWCSQTSRHGARKTETHHKGSMQVDAAVNALRERTEEGESLAMLSHSAGGWLARVYLQDFGTNGFDRLISLGSPHLPPAAGSKGIIDQTRGILKFVDDTIPGAYHGEVRHIVAADAVVPQHMLRTCDHVEHSAHACAHVRTITDVQRDGVQISYVTISSRYLKGCGIRAKGTIQEKVAGAGYRQVASAPTHCNCRRCDCIACSMMHSRCDWRAGPCVKGAPCWQH
jgi:hypothetical protein